MISVIIPTYNAEKYIGKCLKALLSQNYKKRYEIIVVDDGSTDKTAEIVRKFKKVKLIEQEHKGPAAARNLGIKHSKGAILLFTDADCVPTKNWIRFMVEPFKDRSIVGVCGAYKTLNKESLIARFVGYEIERRYEELKKEEKIDFVGTYSAAYRKNILLKIGGFDESFPLASGEDPELSFRLSEIGAKMVFQPKAIVFHHHPDNLSKLLKNQFWRGYWRIFLYKKHPGKLFTHSYTPKKLYVEILFLGVSFFTLPLSIFSPLFFFYFSTFFLLSFFLTLPDAFKLVRKDLKVSFLYPFLTLLKNFFIGLGIVCGIIYLLKKELGFK